MSDVIYKSCSPKYTNEQVSMLSGTMAFVSFARLLTCSMNEAIGKKENEKIVGMRIGYDGINVYIEKE